jgi:hypothetical protein
MTSTEVVTYNWVDESIHEFVFTKPSRDAVDRYIKYLIDMYEVLKNEPVVRILLDFKQSGMLPMRYMQSRIKAMATESTTFPPTHVAYLIDKGMDQTLFRTIEYTADKNIDRTHFSNRDDAIEWLMNQTAE